MNKRTRRKKKELADDAIVAEKQRLAKIQRLIDEDPDRLSKTPQYRPGHKAPQKTKRGPAANSKKSPAKRAPLDPEAVKNKTIGFGRHKGETFQYLPQQYLIWMVREGAQQAHHAEAELTRRQVEMPTIHIPPGVIDFASQALSHQFNTRVDTQVGLYSWLAQMVRLAIQDAGGLIGDSSIATYTFKTFTFEVAFDKQIPTLLKVRANKAKGRSSESDKGFVVQDVPSSNDAVLDHASRADSYEDRYDAELTAEEQEAIFADPLPEAAERRAAEIKAEMDGSGSKSPQDAADASSPWWRLTGQ